MTQTTDAITLHCLPLDLVDQICGQLCRTRPFDSLPSVSRLEAALASSSSEPVGEYHPLDALSRTCQFLRHVCCFRMFGCIELSYDPAKQPPCAILPYVRLLGITEPRLESSDENYVKMFRNMRNLSEVVWSAHDPVRLGDRGSRLLSESPTLRSLTLIDFRLVVRHPLNLRYLRVLDLSQPQRNIFTVTADEVAAERAALELTPLRAQLQVLRVPGESCRSSFLASAPWPELLELVIRGGPPLADAPPGAALRAMPRLRILAAAFEHWNPHRLVLLPPLALPFPAMDLTRLTIADGHPEDALFSHLSDRLTDLSLRDIPRYYWRRQLPGRHGPPLLECREALSILRTIPARNLRRLELVVRDDGMLEQLLDAIAAGCPDLVFFELHLYASDDAAFIRLRPEEVDFPTDRIAKALAPLRHLRALRLNLDLALSGPNEQAVRGRPAGAHRETFRRWHPFLAGQAYAVAGVLPQLDHVAFLTTQALSGDYWSTWIFERASGGKIELRYQDPYGPYGSDYPSF